MDVAIGIRGPTLRIRTIAGVTGTEMVGAIGNQLGRSGATGGTGRTMEKAGETEVSAMKETGRNRDAPATREGTEDGTDGRSAATSAVTSAAIGGTNGGASTPAVGRVPPAWMSIGDEVAESIRPYLHGFVTRSKSRQHRPS